MNTLPATILGAILLGVTTAQGAFTYTTNADGVSVTITGYSGPNTVVIPSTISGLIVSEIGENAFVAEDITSVTIPSSVTAIGDQAFGSCLSLTNIDIPSSVSSIGIGAFGGSGLTSLTIPDGVADIGDGAFSGCDDLTNVTISFGVTSIVSEIFGGCHILNDVVIPGSVTNITVHSFTQCTNLTQVFFTGNAPHVDNTAFANFYRNQSTGEDVQYYIATAYYLPGTTGWAEFSSNTIITPSQNPPITTNIFVPTVLWNPSIQATGPNFGIQNGQYGFDITATNNLPIAIEACDDLSQTNWIVLQRLTLTNGLYHFSEPFDPTHPSRFYRIGFP